jgi:REP element-mobilizing transposase RayT
VGSLCVLIRSYEHKPLGGDITIQEISTSHSVCILYTHIVFSTKDCQPLIIPEWRDGLYAYISAIIKNLRGEPVLINGTSDHIHILCRLPKETDTATFLRNLKANSSKWTRQKHNSGFLWQEGYGAFSVGISNLESVKIYINTQEEHHRKESSLEEYNRLLHLCGITPYGEG